TGHRVPGKLSQRARADFDCRAIHRSHRRRRRYCISARRLEGFFARRAEDFDLSASARGEPGLSEELQGAPETAGPPWPSADCVLVLAALKPLDVCTCQRAG